MKRLGLFVIVLLSGINISYGFEIVYPKKTDVTINSDKTFFIGNEKSDKVLKVNNEFVNIHPSGGFKHVVKLNYGRNIFVISNGKEQKTFTIIRPKTLANTSSQNVKPVIYEKPIIISTSKNNVPLRSTPVDAGLNRLQHLPCGIELLALGEERGFYKVKLGRDGFGFIAKDSAQISDSKFISYANLKYRNFDSKKNENILKIFLDKLVPFTITDSGSGLDVVVYNMDNSMFESYEEHIDGKPFGYSSYYNDDNMLIVLMKNFPKVNKHHPLKNIKITIDPGHGGSEPGAIGCLGTKEKDVNLEIAKNLKTKLEKFGARVFMTREDDSYVGLNERVEASNYFDADIFLSIHNNSLSDSSADKDATGTETYYFYPQSKELAKILSETISESTGFKNGGARGQSFAVVRNTQSIAVLIEVGYMINPDDNSKLIDAEFQNKISVGIINGLERYLRQDDIQR